MNCGIIFPGKTFSGQWAVFNLIKDGNLVRDEAKDSDPDIKKQEDTNLFDPVQISKTAVENAEKAAEIGEELAALALTAAATRFPVKIGDFMFVSICNCMSIFVSRRAYFRCAGEIEFGVLKLGVMKSISTNASYTGRFNSRHSMEGIAILNPFGDEMKGRFERGLEEPYKLMLGYKFDRILKCVYHSVQLCLFKFA